MLVRLYLEYCGPVLIAGIGVLQAAAAYNNLSGLRFFRSKGISYTFSILALIPAGYYFFTWNQQRANGVIEGSQQAACFSLSIFLALLFTLLISSLINHKTLHQDDVMEEGLNALHKTTYFRAIRQLMKRWIDARHRIVQTDKRPGRQSTAH